MGGSRPSSKLLTALSALGLLVAGPVSAETTSKVLKHFEGSSVTVEHAGTIAHQANLSPDAARIFSRSLAIHLPLQLTTPLSLAFDLAMAQELTPSPTTYENEVLLSDVELNARLALPSPGGSDGPLSLSAGLGLTLPTSKASQATTLVAALSPGVDLGITAPLLNGLTFSYGLTPTPRFHRFSTASRAVPYPCSPAAGCTQGRTTDSGARNTAFQLTHDIGIQLSALNKVLSASLALEIVYGRKYAKSPSNEYSEEVLSSPGNDGGDPTSMYTAFLAELGVQVHPAVSVALGLWSPGGMRPDGSWYHPLANRHSQLYFSVTLTPIDGVQAELAQHDPDA